jgi:hypothetical protein
MARRFSFGSPGRFGPGESWFRIGTVDVTTTLLVILLAAVSMVVWAIDRVLLLNLALLPSEVRSGEIWRIVTWPLYVEPEFWTAVTLFIFWILGSEVERLLGRNRFAVLLLGVTVIGGLVATGLDLNVAGIRHVELMVFAVFALEFPGARFFFGIPARALAAVIIALDLLSYSGNENWDAVWFTIINLVTGAVIMRGFGFANDLPWMPRIPMPGVARPGRPGRGPRPGRTPKPKGRGRRAPSHLSVAPPVPSSSLPDDVDRLLDKIASHGIESLTADERARLDQASRRMRDERDL